MSVCVSARDGEIEREGGGTRRDKLIGPGLSPCDSMDRIGCSQSTWIRTEDCRFKGRFCCWPGGPATIMTVIIMAESSIVMIIQCIEKKKNRTEKIHHVHKVRCSGEVSVARIGVVRVSWASIDPNRSFHSVVVLGSKADDLVH